MSCQSRPGAGDVCYYDDDPPGVLGSDCSEHTDCGSYLCEAGACVTPCDLTKGIGCPAEFECSSLDDGANYYCHGLESGGGGGCSTGGAGAGWLLMLGLALAIGRLSRAE